jgi:hypothetical protein
MLNDDDDHDDDYYDTARIQQPTLLQSFVERTEKGLGRRLQEIN